jgi:3-oxoacyl-[acyl-carrier protein] reductase
MRWNQPPDAVAAARTAADRWGTTVIGVHGDAMDWDDVRRFMRECHERLGGIDVLVNNAADAVIGDFSRMSKEDVYRTVQGTLVGPMQCTHAALEYMIPKGSGRIVNVGSGSALAASPGFTVYGTMKAGVNTFTNFLAHEVARHGIQVLGVNAGVMWGPGRQALPPDSVESLIPRLRTAIQRFALPEEVANMVAFLASDAASCMTGTMVDMTGGRV